MAVLSGRWAGREKVTLRRRHAHSAPGAAKPRFQARDPDKQTNPPETIMNARIGQLFDAILTTTMGLASMSAIVAIALGA
jgi:hypothetical protein